MVLVICIEYSLLRTRKLIIQPFQSAYFFLVFLDLHGLKKLAEYFGLVIFSMSQNWSILNAKISLSNSILVIVCSCC